MAWIVEADDWGAGASILAEETLERLRAALAESPLVIEHWFYRGGSAPERLVIDDYDELQAYLGRGWNPGDAFNIWRFDQVCRTDNEFANGKLPDDRGRVPRRGPYSAAPERGDAADGPSGIMVSAWPAAYWLDGFDRMAGRRPATEPGRQEARRASSLPQ